MAERTALASSGWILLNHSSGSLPISWSCQPSIAFHRGEKHTLSAWRSQSHRPSFAPKAVSEYRASLSRSASSVARVSERSRTRDSRVRSRRSSAVRSPRTMMSWSTPDSSAWAMSTG